MGRNMRAMNTFFQQDSEPAKNREKLNTWRSINGKQRGQIDYVNIDTHKANWVQRVEFIGNANPKTENGHKAILMTIENRRKKENKTAKEQPVHVKYDIHKMRREYENQEYSWEKIKEKIKKIKMSNMEIKRKNDKIWEKIETGIRKQLLEKNPKTKKIIEETLNEKEKKEIQEQEKEREKLQKRIEKENEERNI